MFWTVCRHCHRPYPKINLGRKRHDGESLDLKRLTCKFGYGTCFQSAWIPVQVITDTGSGLRVHPGRLSGRYALSAGVTGLGDTGVPQERRCVRQTGSSMHLNRLSQAILVCLLFISCSSAGNGELGSKNFFLEAAEEPRLVRFESNGLVSYRGEGGLVTSMASFEGDEILLHSSVNEGVVAVDVHESESAEYKYSFRLPNYTLPYIMNDRMY